MLRNAHIVQKPWGHEELWAQTARYAGKLLVIKKGHRLSRQYHKVKEETIRVLEGTLTCEHGPYFEGDTVHVETMGPGTIFHVPSGTIHRFCADETDVTLLEVSTHQTSDVVRLEDDYHRIKDIPRQPPISGK